MRYSTALVGLTVVASLLIGVAAVRGDDPPVKGLTEVDLSTTWCGARALWLISRSYDRPYSLDQIKDFCAPEGSSTGDLSLEDLTKAAEKMGLAAMPVHCKADWLVDTHVPALTLHRARNRGAEGKDFLHFYILVGASKDTLRLIDPFFPDRIQEFSRERFQKSWTGYALLVARTWGGLPPMRSWTSLVLITSCLFLPLFYLCFALKRRMGQANLTVPLILIAILGSHGCADSSQGQNGQDSGLDFEQVHHDAGPIIVDRDRLAAQHEYHFVNRSGRALKIKRAQAGCSCTKIRYPEEVIPPNGTGEVELTVDLTGRAGQFKTYAVLLFEEPENSYVKLSHSCFVMERAKASPEAFEFGEIPAGSENRREVTFRLSLRPDEPLPRILDTSHLNEEITYEVGAVNKKRIAVASNLDTIPSAFFSVVARVTPRYALQDISDVLSVRLSSQDVPLKIRLRGKAIHPEIDIEPPVINFGHVGSEPARRAIRLRSRRQAPLPKFVVVPPDRSRGIRIWTDEKDLEGKPTVVLQAEAEASGPTDFGGGTIELKFEDKEYGDIKLKYVRF